MVMIDPFKILSCIVCHGAISNSERFENQRILLYWETADARGSLCNLLQIFKLKYNKIEQKEVKTTNIQQNISRAGKMSKAVSSIPSAPLVNQNTTTSNKYNQMDINTTKWKQTQPNEFNINTTTCIERLVIPEAVSNNRVHLYKFIY